MIKACMNRPWIDKRLQCELAKTPKPLENTSVYDTLFEGFAVNETVNRIPKLQSTHSSVSLEEKAKHKTFFSGGRLF
jgi:hypothetical protein